VIAKVAEFAPAGTVTLAPTDAGVVAKSTTEVSMSTVAFNVTVPVEEFPPTTVLGLRLNAETESGSTEVVAVTESTSTVAVTVAVVVFATLLDVTWKSAELAPEETVTLAGTEMAGSLDES